MSRERDDIIRIEAYERGVADTKAALKSDLAGLSGLKEQISTGNGPASKDADAVEKQDKEPAIKPARGIHRLT